MPRGIALAVLCALLAGPGLQAAQAPAAVPDHSVSGVVRFIDRATLVIRRAGKSPLDMTFGVNASTLREGVIAVGTKVQVRFRGGHPAIATAILASPSPRFSER
jgi:hypothetical protein